MDFWRFISRKPDISHKETLGNHQTTFSSISDMIEIQKKLISIDGNIEISLKECSTLSPANLMLLSSVFLLRRSLNKNTILSFDSNSKIFNYLTEINFIKGSRSKKSNLDFRTFKTEEEITQICNEIKSSSKFTNIDKDERNILISKTYELLINSCEHGKNDIGAMCHCFYKNKKFNFSVYDFGVGIPDKVKKYLNDETMSDIEAIKWTLTSRNSTTLTSDSIFPRGGGLKLIEKFLKDYKGKLLICSGNAYYLISGEKIHTRILPNKISGTLITLNVPI